MDISIIFKIAAVGIIVSVIGQILKHSGREEQAFLTSLAGLILVLMWIIPYIYELFNTIKNLFEVLMFTVGVFGIIIVILALQLKNIKSEYSVVIMIVGCVIIFFYSISGIIKVVEILKKIINDTGINDEQIIILLKIMGISYIAEFVSDIAKDSGYSALSNQIQIYGKITILVVSVPILESLINCINGLLL